MENRNTPHSENPRARAGSQPLEDAAVREDEGIDEGIEEFGDIADVENEADLRLGGDTGFDRVVGPEEVGLGGGLDQAEEARLGVTDEELAEMARRQRPSKK